MKESSTVLEKPIILVVVKYYMMKINSKLINLLVNTTNNLVNEREILKWKLN